MVTSTPTRFQLHATASVVLAMAALLTWEHLAGGIARHHLLHNPDLPAVSNAWGLLLLPALAWFVVGRVQRRLQGSGPGSLGARHVRRGAVLGFACALAYGTLLALLFTLGHDAVAGALLPALLPVALVVPIHRGEYLLGFVMGMTVTFGAVLPTLVGSVVAGVAAILHFGSRLLVRRVAARFGRPKTYPAG